MKIFLAGASGFIGERVLTDLLDAGHEVTALVHSDRSLGKISRTNPKERAVTGDVTNAEDMLRAIPKETEAVVYLPGLLREFPAHDRASTRKAMTFEKVHVEGVRNVLAAAKATGATRWIQMSALGARPNAPTKYFRTKSKAEELIRASGLVWTILRPSLIFDDRPRRQHNFVDEIANAIRSTPFVPILGSGTFLLQPVSVDDVSQTIVQSLAKPETIGTVYEMGGPKKMTYREVVLIIAHAIKTKKPAIKIPLWAMTLLARLLGRFSWFPITLDEIVMLRDGNYVHDPGEDWKWRETFDLPLKPFSKETIAPLLR